MGLFLNQQDNRSELQEKIAADLIEKAKRTGLQDDTLVDGSKDIKYLEGTKQTTSLAWAWLLIFIMAIGVIILLLI